ncbi:FadR family transcriptional regulator [Actinomadura sp. HBU206391]|nr:FadR family transcriptional regulator [Actinomadura sp. HBU206391]
MGAVLQRLEDLIFSELNPGSELPSESALAVQLGVSRLTVREATKALQARGLLDVRQGRRPVVAHPSAGPIDDYFTSAVRRDPRRLMDLLEVRQALEVHIASLAALRAGRASITALESALAAMREVAGDIGDTGAIHDADLRFHEGLAAATGNQMLSFLLEGMEGPLHAGRMRSLRGHLARGGTVEDVIEQHARILDRVRDRDPAGAAAAMRDHLEQTARDLRAALTLTEPRIEPDLPR